jgi:hypothetical protein
VVPLFLPLRATSSLFLMRRLRSGAAVARRRIELGLPPHHGGSDPCSLTRSRLIDSWRHTFARTRQSSRPLAPHRIHLRHQQVVQRCWTRRQSLGARASVVLS